MSKSICVYCSSSDAVSPEFFQIAVDFGAAIAAHSHSLVYGGGNVGLMGAVAQSVRSNGGKVIGVIPGFMRDKGLAFDQSDELVITADMRERKAVMEIRADAFVALPGGFGTLEEIFEVLTLKQLGLHSKPVVFLNSNGFYDGLVNLFEHIYTERFAKPDHRQLYHFSGDVEETISYIHAYEPPALTTKWFDTKTGFAPSTANITAEPELLLE